MSGTQQDTKVLVKEERKPAVKKEKNPAVKEEKKDAVKEEKKDAVKEDKVVAKEENVVAGEQKVVVGAGGKLPAPFGVGKLPTGLPGEGLPRYHKVVRGRICCKGLVSDPKWRVVTLCLMGFTFVILLFATMTTNWRVDKESRYDVFITHGLWRICRDIKFGATLDHKCKSEYANNGPDWFQTVRGFMLMALLACFVGFAHSIYLVATIPVVKNRKYPNIKVSLLLPGVLYLFAAICVLIGMGTYSIATSMDQALYFPENLPPTWGNSWAQVLAKRNSIPSDLPEVANMKMSYGYSFALAWFSLITTTATFIVNFVSSGA